MRPRRLVLTLSAAALIAATAVPVASADEPAGVPAPAPGQAELARELLGAAMRADGAAGLDAADATQAQVYPEVWRTEGVDRYAVAANLSQFWVDDVWNDSWPEEFDKVAFVTSGQVYADALGGGALAAFYGGPVLLTKGTEVPNATRQALDALQPDWIVVLGGETVITDAVLEDLAPYAGFGVDRIAGTDRFGTSAAIVEMMGGADRAYVAIGTDWPDGLAGGAAAGGEYAPLALTRGTAVPPNVLARLRDVTQPSEIVLIGGPTLFSDAVVEQLETVAPVVQVGGGDRYETASLLAQRLPITNGATIATGQDWPDALAGSAYAGLVGDRVLLVKKTSLPGDTAEAIVRDEAIYIDLLGGQSAVEETVVDAIEALEVTLSD